MSSIPLMPRVWTFRVLKNKEIDLYDEYRTGRLALEAFDRLARM